MSKYPGIDEREICCCDSNPNTIEAGISFDQLSDGTHVLRFHYLDLQAGRITQETKSMYLDKANTKQLIAALKSLKFNKKKIALHGHV